MSNHLDRSPDGAQPDVSIILTVHNDATNLVSSVASATGQSYRSIEVLIVDDCSEDDSYAVAVELASGDARVRALQTPLNSGGPGAPRNLGIRSTSAPWVMFLDSDDVLDERAVERLLDAAQRDDADVACGQLERRFLETGEVVTWREELFAQRRHLHSISEFLDLVLDSANGQLYRRTFLQEHDLEYREGVAYEELVFSAQVYSKARSISVVPGRVYIWNVYPSDVRRSISNRREEAINLQHRIEAFEIVFASAAESGREGLLDRYRLKFLEHDAKLYLKDLVNLDDNEAERILATLDPELRCIPDHVFGRLEVHDRLLYGLALLGSVEGVREIKPTIKGHVSLEGCTVASDGRTLWRPTVPLSQEPSPGSLESRLLDITGDDILATPFPEVAYAHRVSSIEALPSGAVRVRGFTTDPLGKLAAERGAVRADVLASMESAGIALRWPAVFSAAGEQRFDWEFEVEWPERLPAIRPMRLELFLETTTGGVVNSSPVWLHKGAKVPRIAPRRLTASWLLRERLVFSRVGAGRLTLKMSEGRLARLAHRVVPRPPVAGG